ncbi:hypothetical protein D3C87_1192150 [compost metagenome]
MNGRDRHDRRGHFHLQRRRVHGAQPVELFLAVVDVELGNEVFVTGNHHHHQQTAHQRHVDQRQQHEDQVRLGHRKNVGDDVEDFLEEFQRQGQQPEGQAEVDRRQQPAGGVHCIFDKAFH